MKICPTCGTQNNDSARFCAKCGSRLPQQEEETQSMAQQPLTQQMPEQQPVEKKSGKLNMILLLCGLVIVVLIGVIVFLVMDDKEENPEEKTPVTKVEYDPAFVSGDLSGSDTLSKVADAPATVPEAKAEPSKSFTVTAHGNIEGYPFSITGKWNGNKFSGTYKNEYNGVKMKCHGEKSGGRLNLTLTSGKSSCGFEFDDLGGGSYTGYFYPDGKRANLQFP